MKRARKGVASAWFELARNSVELMQGSSTVIVARTSAMAAAGASPSVRQKREMNRMVDEKIDASAASLTAMAFSAMSSYQQMVVGSMWGVRAPSATQTQYAMTRIFDAGMAPYRKTVRRNVKRLKK